MGSKYRRTAAPGRYRAYELSNSMSTIDALVGTFDCAPAPSPKRRCHDRARRIGKTPEVKHPSVNMNPVTGRRFLVSIGTDVVWKAMPQDEANSLLDELLAHMVRPENIYEHDWRTGDSADNAVALHARVFQTTEPLVKRSRSSNWIQRNISFHRLPPETGFRNHLRPRSRVRLSNACRNALLRRRLCRRGIDVCTSS